MMKMMNFESILSIQCFSLLLLFLSQSSILAATTNTIPRLSPIRRRENPPERVINPDTIIANDFKTHYYDQTLDHFNYNPISYRKFKQRYVVSEKFWGGGGANVSAPIFAYLGAEAPLDGDIGAIGFLTDNAPFFKSLLVYIEPTVSTAPPQTSSMEYNNYNTAFGIAPKRPSPCLKDSLLFSEA